MRKTENNFAFIDAQNLYLGLRAEGWKIYRFLRDAGFVLIFKTISDINDQIKGNCDGEMILQAAIDIPFYDQAVIVTGDGDFYCLVKYLKDNGKLKKILAPSFRSCSSFLRKLSSNQVVYLSLLKNELSY